MTIGDALVSIVIPVRNGERFVSRTLASALAQTYDPIEIVVVDDGSTDRTASLVESAAANDSRIRFLRTEQSGVAATRNLGIRQARGKLIAPLDADDLWHPKKIASQVEVMQASSPEVGLVYCWSIEIDENDFVILPIEADSGACGRVTMELAKGNFVGNSSAPLIRRSCIDAVGGYDVSLKPHGAEDWKFYLALSEHCEFAVIRQHLVGYRQSSGSLSRDVTGMAQSTANVTHWLTEKWPDLPKKIGRQRAYNTNVYLARRALENGQFRQALRYRATAYKARPTQLLKPSSFEYAAHFLGRMAGLGWSAQKQREAPVRFQEFQVATDGS
jgi:glycosyltransferase involved in cell wall biosynthesis